MSAPQVDDVYRYVHICVYVFIAYANMYALCEHVTARYAALNS